MRQIWNLINLIRATISKLEEVAKDFPVSISQTPVEVTFSYTISFNQLNVYANMILDAYIEAYAPLFTEIFGDMRTEEEWAEMYCSVRQMIEDGDLRQIEDFISAFLASLEVQQESLMGSLETFRKDFFGRVLESFEDAERINELDDSGYAPAYERMMAEG